MNDSKFDSKACLHNSDIAFMRIINSMAGVILPSGKNDITLDFLDFQFLMHRRGVALVGIGEYQGVDAAFYALNYALIFAMEDDSYMQNASGILVHFNMNPEYNFKDISAAMEVLQQTLEDNTDVVFGTTTDDSLPINFVRVTIIGSGVERRELLAVNNVF